MARIDALAGVLIALASPMTKGGAVDGAGIGRLVEHVISGGVHGVLALGSTGETASLDERARREVLDAVVTANAGRVPVLCGIAQSQLSTAIAEVAAAARAGADAALVAPPFYYPTDATGVLAFYREVAAGAEIPILVYNIPQFTKVAVDPTTLATLAREGAVQGIKDSSRDFEYFEGVCVATRDVPGFRIFTGSDTMLVASLAAGGAGTICGAGNVAPAWVVRIYEEFQRGDLEAARQSQDRLYTLVTVLRNGVFPLAIKCALHLQGVCEPWSAPPTRRLDEPLEARLREKLAGWELLTPQRSRQ
ncbi:MAG: dihydrodipicolinate synthase family protein [Chloroflexi bacterium]|nr:MAG: dihydrodipicolinate synthase family protein [Chloroflexota bacterium]